MVIFRPSVPLSPQQQGRLQLLGYPPEVVDGTKFDVYSDSPAPCCTPGCVCSCIDVLYCPSCPSYGYNEGLSRLSLTSLIDQPALELEASLAAGLRFSPRETGLSVAPSSNSLAYPKPIDLKAEQQTQRRQFSGTSEFSNGSQSQETTISRRGLLDGNTQTPDTNRKTSSQPCDGAVSAKISRPSLQGNTWLLANRTKACQKVGLDALGNLSASEQASLARLTPPDTPSPEKNKAVLHVPPAFGSPANSAHHHDNAAQYAQLPSQHEHSPCFAFNPPLNGKESREGDAKRQRCEDVEMPTISPLNPDDIRRNASNNFNRAQEGISRETPTRPGKRRGRAIDSPCVHNTEIRPSSPVSEHDVHLDAAEILTSLGQARKLDRGKGKAADPRLRQLVEIMPYDALQPPFHDFTDAQDSTHSGQTRKLDKGKGRAIDPLWSSNLQPPPSPIPEQALPWNDPISFHRRDDSISQEPPRSPRPVFRSLPAEKPLPPVFSEGTSVSDREVYASIEGRGYDKGGRSNPPPTPRPTPRLRFKPLPARDASTIPQEKLDVLEAFKGEKPAFDPPACFFSDSDTDSEEGNEFPNARREVEDRSKILADSIRDHFQLANVAPLKRAYDFSEPERTRRLLRFDREVATPYIAEHRSVQTSTYEEEENEAIYLQNACGGMINLNKSGDLFDEHRFRWRNSFDRLEKLGKAMTVWSHRGYGAPRSYMEHDRLAHAEMKKRRDYRERMVLAGKVFRRARKAGLCVDREGFVVPPRKETPRVPPGMDSDPSAGDACERDFVRQRKRRWAEKVAAEGCGAGPDDSHDAILPSTEERIRGEWHVSDPDDEGDSDIDEHPELDDLRLARGLPPRRYPSRRLPPFDPMANLRLRNPASGYAQSLAMVSPGCDSNESMINASSPSASASPNDPNPKPYATFCPSWAPRHFSSFVGKINHSKKGAGAEMPKVVLTTPTPEPTDDEWDSEDDEGWAEEEYLQSQGTAGTSFPGWDEAMINGRLRPPQPQDPQPMGTFCPSWDLRHYDHFVKKQEAEGARVPRVVVTMPSPEPGEEGWNSEDEWEEGD